MSGELIVNAVFSVLEMFRFWKIFEIIIESFALRMERRTAIVFECFVLRMDWLIRIILMDFVFEWGGRFFFC